MSSSCRTVLGRTVLVTGCSSGIGRATALLLAKQGFRVFAGLRCPQEAEGLLSEIQPQLGLPTLEPLLLDVTKEDHVAKAVELVRKTSPEGLYGLVNNAGVGLPAAVELSSLDEVRQVFEVNTIGPLRMIQSFLPLLRIASGRIINMSSMNGTMALPMVGAYSASKFALEALSDTLRVELRPWQIPVSIIRPGQVRTQIFEKARKSLHTHSADIPAELKSGYDAMYTQARKFSDRGARSSTSPEKVAGVVLRALQAKRPRAHYHVGFDAHGMKLAQSLVPQRLIDRVLARTMNVFKPLRG